VKQGEAFDGKGLFARAFSFTKKRLQGRAPAGESGGFPGSNEAVARSCWSNSLMEGAKKKEKTCCAFKKAIKVANPSLNLIIETPNLRGEDEEEISFKYLAVQKVGGWLWGEELEGMRD